MSRFSDEARIDFERSQGDVSDGYNAVLKETARIKALISIAESLEMLVLKLDDLVARMDTISTDLQNIEYDMSQGNVKVRTI